MFWKLLRVFLFLLDPEWAHALGGRFLQLRGFLSQGRVRLPRPQRKLEELAGFRLDSPLGLAAGFDKDATMVPGLRSLGFGFLEIGTVTPRPQPGNPRPRLFRLPEARALINRMGFNSSGADAVAQNLSELRAFQRLEFPLGVNLGKNRDTPLERAHEDYVLGVEKLCALADYLVVNLSSPNTPGLTGLQEAELLQPLLRAVRAARDKAHRGSSGALRPLFLKLSPDLAPDARKLAAELAVEEGYGIIASNTSRRRDFPELHDCPATLVAEAGGLSGLPLQALAIQQLRELRSWIGSRPQLISVGGLQNGEDALARLEAGAQFLQVYTELIYSGPSFPRRIARALSRAP